MPFMSNDPEILEKRRFKRMMFREPVQLRLGESQASAGLSSDISEGGIRLNISHFIPLHAELSISMHFFNQRRMECLAKVVWVRQLPYSERYQVGLQFSDESLSLLRTEVQEFFNSERMKTV